MVGKKRKDKFEMVRNWQLYCFCLHEEVCRRNRITSKAARAWENLWSIWCWLESIFNCPSISLAFVRNLAEFPSTKPLESNLCLLVWNNAEYPHKMKSFARRIWLQTGMKKGDGNGERERERKRERRLGEVDKLRDETEDDFVRSLMWHN